MPPLSRERTTGCLCYGLRSIRARVRVGLARQIVDWRGTASAVPSCNQIHTALAAEVNKKLVGRRLALILSHKPSLLGRLRAFSLIQSIPSAGSVCGHA